MKCAYCREQPAVTESLGYPSCASCAAIDTDAAWALVLEDMTVHASEYGAN